jgi:hypothetical protein
LILVKRQSLMYLLWISVALPAQANPESDSIRLRFIKPFEHQFFVGAVLKQRSVSIQLTNASNRKNWVRYVPNNMYSAGVRLNLFGVGIEGGIAVPIAKRNTERFGSSTAKEIQGNAFTQHWFADFHWQQSEGFFTKRSWFKLTSKEIHPQREDLMLNNSGIAFTYIVNHNTYSMRAPYQFSEHQLKSGGSFMLGVIMNRFRISGEGFILSEEDQVYFSEGKDARSTDFTMAALAAGYGYTFIHKDFFLNVTGLAGPSHHWMKYTTNQQAHFDIDLNLYATYRAAVGYNGERSFIGMTFHSKNAQVRMLETSVSNTLHSFRLLAGYRFYERGPFKNRPKDALKFLRAKKIAGG